MLFFDLCLLDTPLLEHRQTCLPLENVLLSQIKLLALGNKQYNYTCMLTSKYKSRIRKQFMCLRAVVIYCVVRLLVNYFQYSDCSIALL